MKMASPSFDSCQPTETLACSKDVVNGNNVVTTVNRLESLDQLISSISLVKYLNNI